MGLEVFDFIPDLVDTNPVGATDFVNEGDDHLRGVKFTLQNQFPNIGQNQMLLTALQLNEAAIKNESNIFTVDQIFQNSAIFDDLTGVNEINSATFRSVSITRWQTQMDAVRNYRLRRFDNAGVFVDDPWSVDAATGVVNFAQVPTIQAAPIWTAGELKLFANANTPG
ncbi:MAG: hypothetical protein KAJ55_15925, partial [Anaerolineales bacterium]|nr:hypothetical protein [Anaerolineales bacterium]